VRLIGVGAKLCRTVDLQDTPGLHRLAPPLCDDQVRFSTHVSTMARSCRFALHSFRKIRPFLSESAEQHFVQALACSAQLASATKSLQGIQNAAAHLVFNQPNRARHTPPDFTPIQPKSNLRF